MKVNDLGFILLYVALFALLYAAVTAYLIDVWKNERKWFYYIVLVILPAAVFTTFWVRPG